MVIKRCHLLITGGLIACAIVSGIFLTGCGPKKSADESNVTPQGEEDTFHADNDIAMTVRSIADAIRVGEPLDTADYNFEGILTDGSGRPLYTDMLGSPGTWDIDVLTAQSVVIRNNSVGDLLPDDLMHYIAESLDINDSNILSTDVSVLDDDDEAERVVYDFGGGYLRFDIRASTATNGLEGPLITITASRKQPEL